MHNKIRLGLDAKRAFCNYRGLGNYSRLVIEGLLNWASEEVEVFLFTPKVSLEEYKEWPGPQARRVQPSGLEGLVPEVWRGLLQTSLWNPLELDLYHGLSHELPLFAEKVKGQRRAKTLVTIHDLIFLRHPELYPPWDRWTYLRKVKYSCQIADSVIAISEQTKIDLIELLGVPENKIKVLYQAIHPRYYSENICSEKSSPIRPLEQPYFLFVGAFEERKNILRLVKAFSRVQKNCGHHLILIGRGAQQRQIEDLVRAHSLQDFVHVRTTVTSEELPTYYQHATALTYFSLFEGFGLPLAEALMSDTLVATSRGSCFPEAGGPGAIYVDPSSEDEIAQALEAVATFSGEERARRLAQGRQFRSRFHWQNVTQDLTKHYRQVLTAE